MSALWFSRHQPADTSRRTSLGYRTFGCRSYRRIFNERTGDGEQNDLQYPTDVVLFSVLWRLRYKLSFRDVAELLLQHGCEVTHETVREWEFRSRRFSRSSCRRSVRAGASRYSTRRT